MNWLQLVLHLFIVVKGDEIYNNVDKVGHLLFIELRRKISLFNMNIDVNFKY